MIVAGRGDQSPGSPLNVPPVLASNFVLGGERAYTRDDGTPTWEAFEEILGGLEHGTAVAFASGMATAAAVFELLPADAQIVMPDDCYQAVVGLAAAGERRGRWTVTRRSPEDTDGWLEATKDADLLWLESPSNPLLHVADLPVILAQPRKPGALAVIDNTFATPLGQQPLELGADIVMHSATKYLGGHSDLMLGAAVARDDGLADQLRERRLSQAASRVRSRPTSLSGECGRSTCGTNARPPRRSSLRRGSNSIRRSRRCAIRVCRRIRPTATRAASCSATAR